MNYPIEFVTAIEKAQELDKLPVSKITSSVIKKYCDLEAYEIIFYLRTWKAENKRLSKKERREQAVSLIQSMIDATIDGINAEVEVSDLEALLDLI